MKKIIADECVDFGIIQKLREVGFDVIAIVEEDSSEDDDFVLQKALDNQCILLTEDKDFGELVIRFRKPNYGIVLIRLMGIPSHDKIEIVHKALEMYFDEMQMAFSVVTSKQIRIKPLSF